MDNLLHFDIQEVISAFVVLFAVIDITGLVPIIIDLKEKGNEINAGKAAFYSLFSFIVFLFMGNMMLQLFHVDMIFVMAIEMIFGVEIFKMDGPAGSATIVPIVFPLIAGAGSFTTLLSLRALYSLLDIIIALVLNILIIYIVIKRVNIIEKLLGKGGVYVLRKFFGIILLAISVRMFIDNLTKLLSTLL